ncbi:TRAP transporter small permease [Desulfobacula sp.]|uniref:TRAP transporter small permease n=1 Tax=Desulfobacula sp. TaxID=2593537 RepID=UPI0026268CBE|nr:TRAP transporter small permease [Desulfobacula sp.]
MRHIIKQVRVLSTTINHISVFGLIFMMFLTCGDIVMRMFSHPIPGTYEIVGFLGAVIVGFALAQTTIQKSHVAVEILIEKLSKPIRKAFFLVTQFLSLGLFVLITFEIIRYAGDMKRAGEVSLTLKIPYFPVLYGIAFSTGVVCLVLFVELLLVVNGKRDPWFSWQE